MILCTDTHGKLFFTNLINKLKNDGIIPNHRICIERFNGPCSQKLERQLKVYAHLRKIDFAVIVVDADGKPQKEIEKMIEIHIPTELKTLTGIVVLKYEIEDWLCISRGISIENAKPSIILKQREGYEKYRLCDYVSKLKIKKLIEECESFCKFIEFLKQV